MEEIAPTEPAMEGTMPPPEELPPMSDDAESVAELCFWQNEGVIYSHEGAYYTGDNIHLLELSGAMEYDTNGVAYWHWRNEEVIHENEGEFFYDPTFDGFVFVGGPYEFRGIYDGHGGLRIEGVAFEDEGKTLPINGTYFYLPE